MKLLVLIMCLAVGLLLAPRHWHLASSKAALESDPNRRSPAINKSSETHTGTAEIARTKFRIRPNHPQPTIEESTEPIEFDRRSPPISSTACWEALGPSHS
jgi:hypothetical protein